MVRALLVGLSAWTGLVSVPATAPGELSVGTPARDARPVILVEHSMEAASPFSQSVVLTAEGGNGLPSVPATSSGTASRGGTATPIEPARVPVPATPRWQPETRLEPAVRVNPMSVRSEPTVQFKPNSAGFSPPVASPGVPVTVETAPLAGAPASATSRVVWSAPAPPVYRGPTALPATPAAPYAIGGVAPQLPPGKVQSRYVAKGLWGDSKTYIEGQPIRNFGRFLTLPSNAGR